MGIAGALAATAATAATAMLAATAVLAVAQGAQAAQGEQAAQASPQQRVPELAWHLQEPPNPAGSVGSSLSGVSCSAADACTAVGSDESVSGGQGVFTTYAERWDGSSWTIQNTPAGTSSNLNGVDCLSATDCVAVGDILTGVGINLDTLAETWNGSTWTIQGTPTPTGATRAFLSEVSCVSATSCEAVGSFNRKTSNEFLFAEKWNGTSWKLQTTPALASSPNNRFNGVSCTSVSSCIAVGTAGSSMLAEHWNGSSWTIMSPTSPAGGFLGGVSCTSANACTAAGDYNNGSGVVSLAERWDGSTWTQQSTPNRIGASVSDLTDVSCASAKQCTSVGGAF
ncbi:MAG TPA: hypothetical protein VGI64_18880, partial [Streptosporangiaceae bacterium]